MIMTCLTALEAAQQHKALPIRIAYHMYCEASLKAVACLIGSTHFGILLIDIERAHRPIPVAYTAKGPGVLQTSQAPRFLCEKLVGRRSLVWLQEVFGVPDVPRSPSGYNRADQHVRRECRS